MGARGRTGRVSAAPCGPAAPAMMAAPTSTSAPVAEGTVQLSRATPRSFSQALAPQRPKRRASTAENIPASITGGGFSVRFTQTQLRIH